MRMGKNFKYGIAGIIIAISILDTESVVKADQVTYVDSSHEVYQFGGYGKLDNETDIKVGTAKRYLASVNSAVTVEDVIYAGLMAGQTEIDLSAYNIPITDIQELFPSILNNHADLFFVNNSWRYTYSYSGYIQKFFPSYSMTGTEKDAALEEFNLESNKILSGIDRNWSDVEKALYIHDYMCTHYEYDNTYTIYDAYGMIKYKKGVCQAYTLYYDYLLEQCGIRSDTASSVAMNHIWNVVNIGGTWYQVDVTWDDSTNPDLLGRANHKYFLKSDKNMASEGSSGHHSWVSNYNCTSTTYDNAFWNSVGAAFVNVDDVWYCAHKGDMKLYRCNLDTMTLEDSLYEFQHWYSAGGFYPSNIFTGLSAYDGMLYFNDAKTLVAFNPSTGAANTVYNPGLNSSINIYGSTMDENKISYVIGDSPSSNSLTIFTYEVPSVINDVEITTSSTELICEGMDVQVKDIQRKLGTSVVVYAANGTRIASAAYIGTGYIVETYTASGILQGSYTVVLKGDVNGDAVINVVDMEAVQKHVLSLQTVTGVYMEAAQLSGKEELSVLDMEIIQKRILGLN